MQAGQLGIGGQDAGGVRGLAPARLSLFLGDPRLGRGPRRLAEGVAKLLANLLLSYASVITWPKQSLFYATSSKPETVTFGMNWLTC